MKNKIKNNVFKQLTISIIIILITSIINPSIIAEKNSIKTKNNLSYKTKENGIFCLTAANPYDYGYKTGKLIGPMIKKLNQIIHFFNYQKDEDINEYSSEQITYLKKYFPYELEELQGLSDSTKIKIDELIYLKKIINSLYKDQCTVTLSSHKATKYNETFLTQNYDSNIAKIRGFIFFHIWRLYSYKIWIVKVNTLRYKYAFFGIPIIRELPIINEKGLAQGGNGVHHSANLSQPVDEGEGLSLVSLRKLTMMTCKNVSEVASLWKNSPRESNRVDGIMSNAYCDKEGGLLIIEETHNYFVAVFGNSTDMTKSYGDILWHTNHFQWLDPNLTGAMKPEDMPDSVIRYDRCKTLLEENYGNITLDVCKQICSDHGGGTNKDKKDSSDICAHPDKNGSAITSFSYIVNPETLTVYHTHRSPCKSRYVCRNLTRAFEREYLFFDYFLY